MTRINANFVFAVPNQRAAAELIANLEESGLFLQTTLVSVAEQQEEVSTGYYASVSCIVKAGEVE